MRAFAELDANGHDTNVFGEDTESFEIGTCSLDAATGHRNIVYDKAAKDLLGKDEECNGNAVDIAALIGVDLMDEEQVKSLIEKLKKNKQILNWNSWDHIKTDPATKKCRRSLYVAGDGVREAGARDYDDNGAFRAVRRVYKLCTDFNQPPSILPISSKFACSWKIFVSLVRASSNINLSFKVETSNLLLALIR